MTRIRGGEQATTGSGVAVGPEAADTWVAGGGTPVAASGRHGPVRILPARSVRWTRRGRRLLRALRIALFCGLVLAAAYVLGALGTALWLLYA